MNKNQKSHIDIIQEPCQRSKETLHLTLHII